MIDRKTAGARALSRVLGAAVLVAILAACDGDAPLDANGGRALPPDGPSRQVNPLCTGTGGTTHAGGSITTATTWPASGNPHRVTGTVTVSTGGTLTVEPGGIVCFEPQTGLQASGGGRLVAQGTAATPIILTARDPVLGWYGVSLQGTPATTSYLTNARVEYASLYSTAVAAFSHPLVIDSTVVRQSGGGVRLQGRTSKFSRSRVDTTTNRNTAAVTLGDSAWFEQSVIRRAAGIGLLIEGTTAIRVLGGRIEASRGTGIHAPQPTAIAASVPVRVVGGASYGIEAHVNTMQKLYAGSLSHQDSLKGNARDTAVILGGTLTGPLFVRVGLPWHVKASISVGAGGGTLRGEPGSLLVLDPGVGIDAHSGGRFNLRGSPLNPVVLTADDPAWGWGGITLDGAPTTESYITNTRVEHVGSPYDPHTAVVALNGHPVRIDSAVIRQSWQAVALWSTGSRLSRSRVDTTLASAAPAVILGSSALMESTRVRASSGEGVSIRNAAVQVLSCEVLDSVEEGIIMGIGATVAIHNCNLVGNGMAGINNKDTATTADVTGNWWGAVGGLTAPGGDGVAGPVTYGPWLTAPYTLPYVP